MVDPDLVLVLNMFASVLLSSSCSIRQPYFYKIHIESHVYCVWTTIKELSLKMFQPQGIKDLDGCVLNNLQTGY